MTTQDRLRAIAMQQPDMPIVAYLLRINDMENEMQVLDNSTPQQYDYYTAPPEILIPIFVSLGGKEWKKDSSDGRQLWRIYFNADVWMKHADFEVSRYNTGNISSASVQGNSISNNKAKAMLQAKLYYDVVQRAFIAEGLDTTAVKVAADVLVKKVQNILVPQPETTTLSPTQEVNGQNAPPIGTNILHNHTVKKLQEDAKRAIEVLADYTYGFQGDEFIDFQTVEEAIEYLRTLPREGFDYVLQWEKDLFTADTTCLECRNKPEAWDYARTIWKDEFLRQAKIGNYDDYTFVKNM